MASPCSEIGYRGPASFPGNTDRILHAQQPAPEIQIRPSVCVNRQRSGGRGHFVLELTDIQSFLATIPRRFRAPNSKIEPILGL